MTPYNHFLFLATQSAAYQNANGVWDGGGTDSTEFVGMCRYETDGKGSAVNGTDGFHVSGNGVIYMPPTEWRVNNGQILYVSSDRLCNTVLCKGKVISSDFGRLHARVWVEKY